MGIRGQRQHRSAERERAREELAREPLDFLNSYMEAATEAERSWQARIEQRRRCLDLARRFGGITREEWQEHGEPLPVRLHKDERIFLNISGVGLVEVRRGRALVLGEKPTMIDRGGTATLTNRRVVFQGPRRTRQWRFDKLLGFEETATDCITMRVSNLKKSSGLFCGNQVEEFRFRLTLALAHFHDDVETLIRQLGKDIEELERRRVGGVKAEVGPGTPARGDRLLPSILIDLTDGALEDDDEWQGQDDSGSSTRAHQSSQ